MNFSQRITRLHVRMQAKPPETHDSRSMLCEAYLLAGDLYSRVRELELENAEYKRALSEMCEASK